MGSISGTFSAKSAGPQGIVLAISSNGGDAPLTTNAGNINNPKMLEWLQAKATPNVAGTFSAIGRANGNITLALRPASGRSRLLNLKPGLNNKALWKWLADQVG